MILKKVFKRQHGWYILKKYAWLPTKVRSGEDEYWVWLQRYWVAGRWSYANRSFGEVWLRWVKFSSRVECSMYLKNRVGMDKLLFGDFAQIFE